MLRLLLIQQERAQCGMRGMVSTNPGRYLASPSAFSACCTLGRAPTRST
jgi:hypothetical protein